MIEKESIHHVVVIVYLLLRDAEKWCRNVLEACESHFSNSTNFVFSHENIMNIIMIYAEKIYNILVVIMVMFRCSR